ncbi:probable methyltransferase PMT24 [Nicotiana tomentosiformis]|uniref:probable methyltransferase PMT24 n=1 Tax=Nicotiana tomentosiformis TaxID=4098 RepID=UPI00051C8973|nr:probable methyltransferase PMT24 [Nicotiana tomentosiformis]XP_009602527.1 probable methyltransferase PMT24 [Nicotiana tomentosiformis]XP_018626833.1 probable methyltransferase PMT24 [Nicotiana tomentosiformis]
MAGGSSSHFGGRKSSDCCSKINVVTSLGISLVGIWMLMALFSMPLVNSEISSTLKVTKKLSGQYTGISGDFTVNAKREEDVTFQGEKGFRRGRSMEEFSDEKGLDSYQNEEREGENSNLSNGEENQEDSGSTDESQSSGESSNLESEEVDSREKGSTSTSGESDNGGEDSNPDGAETTAEDENIVLKSKKGEEENEIFPAGDQSEILKETTTQNGPWSTQAAESKKENESQDSPKWKTCKTDAGPDYIPCLDNVQAIRKLPSTSHYEHRERHCPIEASTCLVPLPSGYKQPIGWPRSREQIWYSNVPHGKLAKVKGHQNWVKVTGEYLTFPGGGTQFKQGALHYIDFLQKSLPQISWGKQTRVILDVGCGVASFGGYLFERDVLAMSLAPKDEHEAQVQFALERGIPAISAVMGTKRLPFPSKVFDAVHCARCRVPWHIEGGKLLLELNRVLRPGGHFLWSATPVYRKDEESVGIWEAMSELTKSMCWELVEINEDKLNEVGVAIFRKPTSNDCYQSRTQNDPPMCEEADDPDAAWNITLEACMHKAPADASERGSRWPSKWPLRSEKRPYWLTSSQVGVYGKAAPADFAADNDHWKHVVSKSYLNGLGINWSSVRNVMDMKAVYGGFAAALKDLKVWVMNVVPIDSPDTLPIIYERGFFGIYHDWCESFSTYPRSYDLLHADHLFSDIKKRCKIVPVFAEVDRILRPEGKLIVRDNAETILEIENMARSAKWKVKMSYSKDGEGLLFVQKSFWRPKQEQIIKSAIA